MSKHDATQLLILGCALTSLLTIAVARQAQAQTVFSPYVDARGGITVPADYRTRWVFLGAWSIHADAGSVGVKGLHNVYTQPGVVEAWRSRGEFPDGTVLIKELLGVATQPMTTGVVSHGAEIEGWFVMVKDTKGRFPGNTLWGDGWGWALFGPDRMLKTVDYKSECLGCHIPAKRSDWIYIEGYPPLR